MWAPHRIRGVSGVDGLGHFLKQCPHTSSAFDGHARHVFQVFDHGRPVVVIGFVVDQVDRHTAQCQARKECPEGARPCSSTISRLLPAVRLNCARYGSASRIGVVRAAGPDVRVGIGPPESCSGKVPPTSASLSVEDRRVVGESVVFWHVWPIASESRRVPPQTHRAVWKTTIRVALPASGS